MSATTVRWISGKQFVGVDSTNHSLILSSPAEGVGVKPSDLLLLGLASCTAVDVVEILNKKRRPLSSLEIVTSGEQDADPPWTFRKIHMKFRVGGDGLTDKAVRQAIELSEGKYCSVVATVKNTAQITTEYEIINSQN